MMKVFGGILLYMLLCFSAVEAAEMLDGSWRGNVVLQKPDGVPGSYYAGINLTVKEGLQTGRIMSSPAALSGELEEIVIDQGQISFGFTYKDAPARFSGAIQNNQITGLIESIIGTTEMQLEKVERQTTEHLDAIGGLFRLENGEEVLLAAGPWYFDFYNLTTGAYALAFPADEQNYFTGPSGSQLMPVTRRISLSQPPGRAKIIRIERGDQVTMGAEVQEFTIRGIRIKSREIELSGKLFVPNGGTGQHPAVVSMVGSGRQDHKGFNRLNLYRAMWLVQKGFVVLVYDKEGMGESGGDYEQRTHHSMAQDMAAAAEFLARQPEVDVDATGILVHSQSGIYAPDSIQATSAIKFAIVLNATVVNAEIQEIVRTEQQLRADSWPEQDIKDAVATQILKFYYANNRIGWDAYVDAYHRVKDKAWFEEIIGSTIDKERSSWDFWRSGNSVEPSGQWAKINIPVLFFFGMNDAINPIRQGIDLLKNVSFVGERADLLTIREVEGMVHDGLMSGPGSFDILQAGQMSPYLQESVHWLEQKGILSKDRQ